MATKDTAKGKYLSSTRNELALKNMTKKLSIYLKHPITETSPPVAEWIKGDKSAWFEKCYKNMQKAYGIEE